MNAIDVKDLAFRFPDGAVALRGVSFAVAEGECVGLIGPNGAGKSTLLWHLNGLLPETPSGNGDVRIFGDAITSKNLHSIRRQVGLLFQDPDDQIFCPTVFEDVAFGPQQTGLSNAEVAERVQASLGRVGLQGYDRRSPHHLSGGEKRRVCLAGVLACDCRILVLDEPTAELDPRGRREFKAMLREISATKIIATHDLDLVAELCTRALVLDGGAIIADGPGIDVLSNEALMLKHGLEKPHYLQHLHPHSHH